MLDIQKYKSDMLVKMDRNVISDDMFYKLYSVISKYDLPKHADRDFVFNKLINFFSSKEEFIKCVNLTSWKTDTSRNSNLHITCDNLNIADIDFLKSLGYIVSDSTTKQVLINNNFKK